MIDWEDIAKVVLIISIVLFLAIVATLVLDGQAFGVNAVVAGGPITCVENPTFMQHIHTHLNVFAGKDRHAVTIPQQIGFINFLICSLHTHAPDGWIHIESMDAHAKYTLAQFLDVWKQTKPANFVHVFGSINFNTSQYNNIILKNLARLYICVNC